MGLLRVPLGAVSEQSPAGADTRTARAFRRHRSERRAGFLFLGPALLFFLIFLILPTISAIFLSLSSWAGYDISTIEFVGIGNYLDLLTTDKTFLTPVLTNTFLYATITVLLAVVGALVVAQLIEHLKFQGFWRFLYFLPFVATVVATGNIWKMMYQPSGLINGLLNALGVNSIGFLSQPDIALPSIAVVHSWASIGTAVLILAAGLKAIDQTMYEAAEIDGAGQWTCFWRITIPLLKPALLFVLITQCIAGLQSFALIIVMTGDGGPDNATNIAAFDMYQRAFRFGAWGTASALAMILFVLILAITLFQLWISKRVGE